MEDNENISKVYCPGVAFTDDKTAGFFSNKQKWDNWTG